MTCSAGDRPRWPTAARRGPPAGTPPGRRPTARGRGPARPGRTVAPPAIRRAATRTRARPRPGPGRATPRRPAAAAGWSSARGRSRWPAARRRTGRGPRCRAAVASIGNASSTASTVHGPAGPGRRRRSRFSSTVSSGNSRRPSGTSAMPRRDPPVGRQARDVLAVEAHAPAGGRVGAGDGAQQRRLARAVGADQGEHLALVDGEDTSAHAGSSPCRATQTARQRAVLMAPAFPR